MKYFNRYLFVGFLSLFFFSLPLDLLATRRGIRVVSKQGQPLYLYKDYHALVIGVSDYSQWPKLPNAAEDAQEVAAKLKEMGFTVRLVVDPNARQLKMALANMSRKWGIEKNRALVFYFAGHGDTTELADGRQLGYIIPRDCPLQHTNPIGFEEKAVSMQEMEMVAFKVKSKHLLMLFDSCFSGSLFTLTRAAPTEITEKSAKPVRQFITAGGADESVPDRSIFKVCLFRGLEGDADYNRDKYVTGCELGMYLQTEVVNYSRGAQHPQYGKINNPHLDQGDFIFVSKAAKAEVLADYSADGKAQIAEELERLKCERERLEAERKLLEERRRLEAERRALSSSTSPGLEGEFYVDGTNPNGSKYHGKAFIERNENKYKITWKIGRQTFYGSGTLSANMLYVKWTGGLVAYTITENGILKGIWADGKGTETLIPHR